MAAIANLPAMPEMSANVEELVALFEAVTEGDSDEVEALLAKGVEVNGIDEDGNTALHLAAEGEPQIVAALIAAKCDVNIAMSNSFGFVLAIQY